MQKIIINEYKDLLKINSSAKELEITFADTCSIPIRKRAIDFLSGLTHQKGKLTKINKNTFLISIE